jgi:hypothetical protein
MLENRRRHVHLVIDTLVSCPHGLADLRKHRSHGAAGTDKISERHPVIRVGSLENNAVPYIQFLRLQVGEGRREPVQLCHSPRLDRHLQDFLLQKPGAMPYRRPVHRHVGGGIGRHRVKAGINLGFVADVFNLHAQLIGGYLAVRGLRIDAAIGTAPENGCRAVLSLQVYRYFRRTG